MSVEDNSSVPSDSKDKSEHLSSEDKESVEVNGFQVHVSKEFQVKEMFKEHPNLDSNFIVENQNLKNSYMDSLLNVTETLYYSTKLPSLNDLYKVDNTLLDLTRAGFKVDWLCQRLEETYVRKEIQRVREARIRELEKLVEKQKLNLLNLVTYLMKEKATVASAAAAESIAVAGRLAQRKLRLQPQKLV